ncbi:MAG: sensor histidine kinase [Rubellimicrobium sp.]|nr:sensor histidine kinase [Rubellimicrobium sp.]
MTAAPKIDVRDLNSVRRAARDMAGQDRGPQGSGAQVLLGDDWVAPSTLSEREILVSRRRRGFITLNRSPLARKIITFNLIALILLVTGMLWLTSSRDNLALQRANGLVNEVQLVSNLLEAQLPPTGFGSLGTAEGFDAAGVLDRIDLRGGAEVFVFDTSGDLIARKVAPPRSRSQVGLEYDTGGTLIIDLLNGLWNTASRVLSVDRQPSSEHEPSQSLAAMVPTVLQSGIRADMGLDSEGRTSFTAAAPVMQNGRPVGVVAMTAAAGEIDALARREREQVLQMFVVGLVVSIGLSLVLASTIANPIADLAAAAELGRARNARRMSPGRIRIPDLTARPDEIGRLSAALRGMVSALYERIEANEQFAADVAHEIKNPLASLRSAVGTLRVAKRDDQRATLLDIIDHDVSRLDRLVTDISHASRLDSELVKEDQRPFDLLRMLSRLVEHHAREADKLGIDLIDDLPPGQVIVHGLEGRLAQVFTNLIGNAVSFCDQGDAIRLWVRKRESRVLIVVEDTGPGIPEDALEKIFQRFYSERPQGQFGNNSGLGLAISKQIVEAHGGVIWAENIRPTEADATSEPLGARFVVGLPV